MHVLSLPMPIYVDDCALIGEDTAEVDAEMEAFHLRTWMQSQHQADPIMGVRSWDNFFDGIKVLSWVPAEPRRRCPIILNHVRAQPSVDGSGRASTVPVAASACAARQGRARAAPPAAPP